MGKQSFRNITILNNGVEEKWKWRFGTKDVTVISPDNKKTYIPTLLLTEEVTHGDSNELMGTYVSPKMVASHIYGMLGLVMPEKKVVPVLSTRKEDAISYKKSKIYVIVKTHSYIDDEYGCLSKSTDIFEIWQDPSKAKKRAEELNKDAVKIYLYDKLYAEYSSKIYTGEYRYGEYKFKLLQEKGYQGVDYFKDNKEYQYILDCLKSESDILNKERFQPKSHKGIGYEFHAEERDLMV